MSIHFNNKNIRLHPRLPLLAIAVALFLCSCSAGTTTSADAASSDDDVELTAMESFVDVQPEATFSLYISANPVDGYYLNYRADTTAPLTELTMALNRANTLDALNALMHIEEHNLWLSQVYLTCGKLTSTSSAGDSGFSDSLFGVASGSGSIIYDKNGVAQLSYSYNNGAVLTGTLAGDTLFFSIESADDTVFALLTMDDFSRLSCVDHAGERSVLYFDGSAHMVCFPLSSEDAALSANTPITWDALTSHHPDATVYDLSYSPAETGE